MKSLFITNKFLGDGELPVTGTYKRLTMFLEAVSSLSDEMELIVFVGNKRSLSAQDEAVYYSEYAKSISCHFSIKFIRRDGATPKTITRLFKRPWDLYSDAVHGYFQTGGPTQIKAIRDSLSAQPDLVFCHRLISISPLLRAGLRHPAIFLDLDDVEHKAHVRHALAPPRWLSKNLLLLHTPPLVLAERRALRLARRTYVCSALDRDYLRRLFRARRVESIANAVTIPPRQPMTAEPTLLFLGSAIFAPNLAATNWLIERVWPLIHAAIPNARLLLAGEFQDRVRSFNAPPDGVEFRGYVADLQALYSEVRVVTCPVLSGSGTRVKLIEAAAHGRPAVSTHLGAEGLALQDEQQILLRDSPADFAAACIRLLGDFELCQKLGDAARSVAEQHYDRAAIIQAIQASMRTALAEPA
jgi:glycosyltransferase involved in cell wall biosynthesis